MRLMLCVIYFFWVHESNMISWKGKWDKHISGFTQGVQFYLWEVQGNQIQQGPPREVSFFPVENQASDASVG